MKRIITIILLALLLLSGCGAQVQASTGETKTTGAQVVATPRPTTSQGTPITDGANLPRVNMRETPDSSCFSSIGYDRGTGTLFVVFRDSGAEYAYGEVPVNIYIELCEAESMGNFYNEYIKGYYECCKIEP